jgi:hypothetical protein
MRRRITLLFLITIVFLLAGCRSAPEVLPQIIPWSTTFAIPNNIKLTTSEPDGDDVQLTKVTMAADGSMVMVSFRGPAKILQNWLQGNIYIVDEATDIQYGQITVAPVVGPLFARPQSGNGGGYVMLNNPGGGIRPGSVVTVVLGNYKRIHVQVE